MTSRFRLLGPSALTGDKRDPQVPEIPTLQEAGITMAATARRIRSRAASPSAAVE